MKLPPLRIQQKIVIPFTLVCVAATAVAGAGTVRLISNTLDQRQDRQIDRVAQMISRAGFALNPAILGQVKRLLGADVVTYERGGRVLVSTLEAGAATRALAEIHDAHLDHSLAGHQAVVRDLRLDGAEHRIVVRRLSSPSGAFVALVVPTADVAEVKAVVLRSVVIIAVLFLSMLALISQVIARSVTAPVAALVESTKRLQAGDLAHEAAVTSRDEIGELARAFNDMVGRLRATEHELVQSEKLSVTGQLAARVAHDVRNPLSSIKMRAQLLRTRLQPGEENRQVLEAILREIDRVEWVVGGLLDLSRPADLQLAPGDLNAILGDALASVVPKLRHLKIEVQQQLDPGLPRVEVDAERLAGAVLNLLFNAAEAMPEGGRLVLRTGRSTDGAHAVIEIRDHGSGIDAAIAERVFDPFFTTKPDGVGLGLLNTRSVVRRHGGELSLQAAPGGGTLARITLPLGAGGAGEPRDAHAPAAVKHVLDASEAPWPRS